MNRVIVILTSLLFTSVTFAETWIQVSDGTYMLECPDAITFDKEKYVIFNDCYGLDPKYPVIETGRYENKEGFISFIQREPTQQSFLGEDTRDRKLTLERKYSSVRLSDGAITFYFKVSKPQQ